MANARAAPDTVDTKLRNVLRGRKHCDVNCIYYPECPLRGLSSMEAEKADLETCRRLENETGRHYTINDLKLEQRAVPRCLMVGANEFHRDIFKNLILYTGKEGTEREMRKILFFLGRQVNYTNSEDLEKYLKTLISYHKTVYTGKEEEAEESEYTFVIKPLEEEKEENPAPKTLHRSVTKHMAIPEDDE